MPGTFFPPPWISNPDMDHRACVTHVPWSMPGSLTSSFLWSWWRGKRPRHSWRMRIPQFFVSGKRPMAKQYLLLASEYAPASSIHCHFSPDNSCNFTYASQNSMDRWGWTWRGHLNSVSQAGGKYDEFKISLCGAWNMLLLRWWWLW